MLTTKIYKEHLIDVTTVNGIKSLDYWLTSDATLHTLGAGLCNTSYDDVLLDWTMGLTCLSLTLFVGRELW